jgi:hypothetical protein
MRRIKQYLSFVLILTMFVTSFTTTFAYNNTSIYRGTILEQASKVEIIENGEVMSIAYAIINGERIQVEWNRLTNEVILKQSTATAPSNKLMMTLDDAQKNETETNFKIEFDKKLNYTYNSGYNDNVYPTSSLPTENIYTLATVSGAISLTVVVGKALMDLLISAAVTIVVSGELYTKASEITRALSRKEYNHYLAILRTERTSMGTLKKLYIGPAINTTKNAGTALRLGDDVWSVSKRYAELAASSGSNGPIIGPEIDTYSPVEPQLGWDYYHHFHLFGRLGGHSFFGERATK